MNSPSCVSSGSNAVGPRAREVGGVGQHRHRLRVGKIERLGDLVDQPVGAFADPLVDRGGLVGIRQVELIDRRTERVAGDNVGFVRVGAQLVQQREAERVEAGRDLLIGAPWSATPIDAASAAQVPGGPWSAGREPYEVTVTAPVMKLCGRQKNA